ncbi:hypothetical protein IMSHALPRED_001754 [Imshaugia aleurites]|uniref:Uncharacterized protein n=1 Tax=Imshaugia aleurites TaxID=172621 RepID=A0A8H3J3W6_9LECA|nr:hypothetical protein IMSHALPRED_001754 [Imshaugia aleurites]
MLIQSCWLSSLLIIASATAHAFPPAGLKPRYLATGTGISLPSTIPPPYPTSNATGISAPTGSIYPTSSISTATPTPTASGPFYLVVADTGTDLDGEYAYISADTSGADILVLYLANAPDEVASFSTFNLNADGTLQNEFAGGIAAIFPGGTSGSLFFENEVYVDEAGDVKSICEIVGGVLTCQTGADTVFFVCPFQDIFGTLVGGTINVGLSTQSGCTTLTLLAVPV